jgi:hypothetical protein
VFLGVGLDGVLLSLGDFRAPALSLRIGRCDVALEEGFELFMRLFGTYCELLRYASRYLELDHRKMVDVGIRPSLSREDFHPHRMGQEASISAVYAASGFAEMDC